MKFLYKFAVCCFLAVVVSPTAFAQYTSSSFFMEQSWQSNMLNPASTPERGYVLIPIIGGTGISLGSNSLTVDKLFYADPNGGDGLVSFLDVDINKSSLLNSISSNNNLQTELSTTIFGVGMYVKNVFWTFGMNLRVSGDVNIPKGLFEIAALNQADGIYNLDNLSLNMQGYVETYVGASFKIGDKLSLGAKAKFLMGVLDMTACYDDLQVQLNDSQWSVSADGYFNATAAGLSINDAIEDFSLENIEYNPEFNISGYGLGFDFGANYDVLENLTLSLSVLDLGFMSWGTSNSVSAISSSSYSFSGVTFTDEDGESSSEDLSIDDVLSFEEVASSSRTTSLRTTINAGVEYRFLKDKMAAGLLYSARFRYGYTQHEVTAVVSGRPCNWFTANVSYNFIAGQMGAAVNFHPKWINFFLGADYIPFSVTPQYIPTSSSYLNLYAGIGIPLGKRPE
ncbi:MAG: DUF5723 family protein [Rikenellaceae bacterium]